MGRRRQVPDIGEDLEGRFGEGLQIAVENTVTQGVDPHEIVTQLQTYLSRVAVQTHELGPA